MRGAARPGMCGDRLRGGCGRGCGNLSGAASVVVQSRFVAAHDEEIASAAHTDKEQGTSHIRVDEPVDGKHHSWPLEAFRSENAAV